MSDPVTSGGDGLSGFDLNGLMLDQLEVHRLGYIEDRGRFTWNVGYRITHDDDTAFCLVVNDITLYEVSGDPEEANATTGTHLERETVASHVETDGADVEDEPTPVASLRIAHMVLFSKPEGAVSQNQRAELLRVARMAVHPLVRAHILTLTSDLGFPPLTLPLLHYAGMPSAIDLDAAESSLDGA